MPRIKSKQILGETPINPNDLATKGYVDGLIASGITGGGSIIVEDDGSVVLSGATIINFIGVDVVAQNVTSGTTKRVNVYIPPPSYVSNFNTNNGTTNASVSPISTTSRYIALPDSEGTPYKIGNWVGGQTHSTIRNSVSNLIYSTIGDFSIYNLLTTFTVIVYDADGTTTLATNSLTLNQDTTSLSNNITITVTGFGTNADRYKAQVSVNIDISTILPQGGRFSVLLRHNNGSEGTYNFTQNNIFRDSETLTTSIIGTLSVLPFTPVVKQISGVYYYTTGSEWNVNLSNVNNLNSRSYPSTRQLNIVDNNLIFTSEDIQVHGEGGGSFYTFDLGTWNQQHDTSNAVFDKEDWTTDEINQTNWNHNNGTIDTPTALATSYDWVATDTESSSTYNYLIDTFVDESDRNSELFRTETHTTYPRLTSGFSSWDNTEDLLTYDGGDGLQIIGDRLVYPQYDFTAYTPNTISQPNYTTSTGDKTYYRRFDTNGSNVSNGIIVLSDHNITESDLSTDNIKIEINIDTGLGWHILNEPYTTGVLENGDGCRIDPVVYSLDTNNSIRFTLGQLQLSPQAGTSSYIYIRITFSSSAIDKYIGGIDISSGNWD